MSNRACIKFVLRLIAEGHDLSQPVDLNDHCARHGTNNFVTIKLILYSISPVITLLNFKPDDKSTVL
ncbi:hypothetical protein J1N35_010383 [Gossypium stocksii]|uniref:GAGA-binding transcriptional activator n=1 Tax=Gossypium stocksii TaxID=47602 RepID=A0A9D3W2D7_9ROSI|nr:hypothetical protein J1N35_010383 [Gossypium stocksii]